MKPNLEQNNNLHNHPAPGNLKHFFLLINLFIILNLLILYYLIKGTVSNASTDSTLVWDNVQDNVDNNNLINENRNFSNTLSMSTNGEFNKSKCADCSTCEHFKCPQCVNLHKNSYAAFTNIALDLSNEEVLNSLENEFGSVKNGTDDYDDDDVDREIEWNDFNISMFLIIIFFIINKFNFMNFYLFFFFSSKNPKGNHRFNAGKLARRIARNCSKSAKHFSLKEQLFTMFPLFYKLKKYDVKRDLILDFIAGITISILHVPQGIAYSFLIGIPPVYGLYTSFFPVLIYSLLGTSSHISVGKLIN